MWKQKTLIINVNWKMQIYKRIIVILIFFNLEKLWGFYINSTFDYRSKSNEHFIYPQNNPILAKSKGK